jgi:serine/threonine protein kinase
MNDALPDFLLEHGYILQYEIGSGRTSAVYLVTSSRYGDSEFAIKRVNRCHDDGCMRREMSTLCTLAHPNVIKLYEYFEDDQNFYFVLEYCSGGSVMDRINRLGRYQSADLYSACSQIISGLAYSHSYGVSHGDIKPHNILIDSYQHFKLADFGLSQKYQPHTSSTQFLGSLAFMPPEIIAKRAFDPFLADVWSLGVTFYWMATGENPWGRGVDIMQAVQCGIPIMPPQFADPEFRRILRLMGDADPTLRISIQALAIHPLFQQADNVSARRVRPQNSILGHAPFRLNNADGKAAPLGSLRSLRSLRTVDRGIAAAASARKVRISSSATVVRLITPMTHAELDKMARAISGRDRGSDSADEN